MYLTLYTFSGDMCNTTSLQIETEQFTKQPKHEHARSEDLLHRFVWISFVHIRKTNDPVNSFMLSNCNDNLPTALRLPGRKCMSRAPLSLKSNSRFFVFRWFGIQGDGKLASWQNVCTLFFFLPFITPLIHQWEFPMFKRWPRLLRVGPFGEACALLKRTHPNGDRSVFDQGSFQMKRSKAACTVVLSTLHTILPTRESHWAHQEFQNCAQTSPPVEQFWPRHVDNTGIEKE